jgi:uncharacterized damage-inducible protein DinB
MAATLASLRIPPDLGDTRQAWHGCGNYLDLHGVQKLQENGTVPPSTQHTETSALLARLDAQRRHVLGILDGLGEADLRRSVLPSGWTILGLVQHLTLDVERFWFSAVVAGDRHAINGLAKGDEAWQVSADVSGSEIFERYLDEGARANRIIGSVPLDAKPLWWPTEQFGDWRLESLREIVLHVIVETACHAGHLDVMRELQDGKQWIVNT